MLQKESLFAVIWSSVLQQSMASLSLVMFFISRGKSEVEEKQVGVRMKRC